MGKIFLEMVNIIIIPEKKRKVKDEARQFS